MDPGIRGSDSFNFMCSVICLNFGRFHWLLGLSFSLGFRISDVVSTYPKAPTCRHLLPSKTALPGPQSSSGELGLSFSVGDLGFRDKGSRQIKGKARWESGLGFWV